MFVCPRPVSMEGILHIRWLDATGSGMTLSDVKDQVYLVHLLLIRCSLTSLPEVTMLNLRFVDLSENDLKQVNMTSFLVFEWTQANPQSFRVNDIAPRNMESMFLTLDTSHFEMSTLNDLAC